MKKRIVMLSTLAVVGISTFAWKATVKESKTELKTDISKIQLVCGADEYSIDQEQDIKKISDQFEHLTLTEYTGDTVCGFSTIKFQKADGTETTISLTTDLMAIEETGKVYKMDEDLLASIREIADTYELNS